MADIEDQTAAEQAEAIRDAVAADVVEGIQSVSVDGLNVVQSSPMARLDVADRLAQKDASNNPFGRMRHARIISPGAWE